MSEDVLALTAQIVSAHGDARWSTGDISLAHSLTSYRTLWSWARRRAAPAAETAKPRARCPLGLCLAHHLHGARWRACCRHRWRLPAAPSCPYVEEMLICCRCPVLHDAHFVLMLRITPRTFVSNVAA